MDDSQTQLLLRLPTDLKSELQREANYQGRKLTQEINIRLRESLNRHAYAPSLKPPAPGIAPAPQPTHPPPPNTLHDENPLFSRMPGHLQGTEAAMLAVFRAMPPEKQLALLSLFR